MPTSPVLTRTCCVVARSGYRSILDAMHAVPDLEDLCPAPGSAAATACAASCPKPCAATCAVAAGGAAPATFAVRSGDVEWVRPTTTAELFASMTKHAGQAIKLVFGNTSVGIYKHVPVDVYLDVSQIADLQQVTATSTNLVVGAGVSLTNTIAALQSYATRSPSFAAVAAHLLKVANVPVRNAASWAGNVMLVNAHHDFPSDVFTVFAAVGARLIIATDATSWRLYDMFDFRSLDMTGKVILSVTMPFLSKSQVFVSYKVCCCCEVAAGAGAPFTTHAALM